MFNMTEWKNPEIFRLNEMEDRAYFIPFSSCDEICDDREKSSYFFLLNGLWKFSFKPSISKTDKFYENDFDCSNFDEIPVPSCWQTYGYDYAQYQTSPYPFIFDPPNVPAKNPVGEYVYEFDFNPDSEKIMSFILKVQTVQYMCG